MALRGGGLLNYSGFYSSVRGRFAAGRSTRKAAAANPHHAKRFGVCHAAAPVLYCPDRSGGEPGRAATSSGTAERISR